MKKANSAQHRALIKKAAALALALLILLPLISCANNRQTETPDAKKGGAFQYPENPAEALRSALAEDAAARGLSMSVGKVRRIQFDGFERAEIPVALQGGEETNCVIFFNLKSLKYNAEYLLDGHDNPSFTIAFKASDNTRDTLLLLASVARYLSPELSVEAAEKLAANQDETLSIDGCAQPQDIGGYQLQARYTNPYIFARAREFDAVLGVTVTAVKQAWGARPSGAQELISERDYHVITPEYKPQENNYQNKTVYADFTVKNVRQHEEVIHGDTWETVDVTSESGREYTLRVETMRMAADYEFGVGQQYTLYIRVGGAYGAGIIYAEQKSSSSAPASRGQSQPLGYPNSDGENPVVRIEPEGDGEIFDVCFSLTGYITGEPYAALSGRGIGAKQWPNNPVREGYEFAGWFDNAEGSGEAYGPDTPIYQNTTLYARWKYTGSGGIWPRAHRGKIQGLDDGARLLAGQELTVIAEGYNMNLEAPGDQRFRWKPTAWRLSDGAAGLFTEKAPFQATIVPAREGTAQLYVTYSEEIFDGVLWQTTGRTIEVQEGRSNN